MYVSFYKFIILYNTLKGICLYNILKGSKTQAQNKYMRKETSNFFFNLISGKASSVESGARNKHAIRTKCIFYKETTKYFCKSICSEKIFYNLSGGKLIFKVKG